MNKLIYPDANEALYESVEGKMATLIDSNKMIKQASSNSITREMLEECKPDKDHFLIHAIGVGDYEKYGFNKNADAFPKLADENYYNTFEKYAHVFKEHNSSNPEKNAIGIVKKACYNKDMGRIELALWVNIKKASEDYEKAKAGEPLSFSMGCFLPGTKILLSDFSEKNIEEIKIGDQVITHKGNVKPVYDILPHPYNGDIYTLKISGLSESTKVTQEHPYYIRRYENNLISDGKAICPVCNKQVKQLCTHIKRNNDSQHLEFWKKHLDSLNDFSENWIEVRDLKVGDYTCSPIKEYKIEQGDEDFAKLCGYYLAEGNLLWYKNSKNKKYPVAIELNFHINEDNFINEVISLFKKFSNKDIYIQKREEKTTCRIVCWDKDLAKRIFDSCGHHSWEKRLSEELMRWDDKSITALLNTFINGDGTYNSINHNLSVTTVSPILANQIIHLSARIGKATRLYINYNINKPNKKPYYTLTFTKKDSIEFDKFSGDSSVRFSLRRPEVFCEGKYIYRMIKSISKKCYEDIMVYNFSVEDDESYIANKVAVHNCSVVTDRDSISGKLSRTMNEYEPWMKKTPGQYIPEYKKYAFVYNDEPKFFDISIVKRPAERIAHYLEYKFNNEPIKDELLKSAAVNNTCIPSALLAEIEGLRYTLNPEFSNIKKANIVNRLAEKEKEFIDILSDKSINTPQAAFIKNAALVIFNPEDEEDFDLSNITIRPKTLFRELACRKTILPFKSFMKCFFPEECIQDKDAIDFASIHLLPNLFSNLNSFGIDMNSLDGLFDAGNSIDSILDNADSDPVQKLMNSVEDKFSLDTDKRGKRIIKIIINKDSNIPFEDIINNILPNILNIKTATSKLENKNVYNTAIKYASIYAAYKVAAIKDIEELKENKNKLDDASMYSLIAQDYIYNLK